MIKKNQTWLETELAIMKSFLDRHLASKVTMPKGSNRATNKQVIFLKELEFILL